MTTTTWMTFPPSLIIMLAKDTLESVLLLWSLGGRYSYPASLPRHTLFPKSMTPRRLCSWPPAGPFATAESARLRAGSHSFVPRTRSSCAGRSPDPAIASVLAPPPPRHHSQLQPSLQRLTVVPFRPLRPCCCFKNQPRGARARLNSLYSRIPHSYSASAAFQSDRVPLGWRCSCAAGLLPGSARTVIQVAY